MSHIDRRAFLASAAALAATPAAAPAAASEAGWAARAPMPYIAQEIYATTWGGLIITAGGLVGRPRGGLFINDDVAVYDPRFDNWTPGPRLPEPRHHLMLVEGGDGRVYAFGGYDRRDRGDWTAMPDAWTIDQGVWVPVRPMPQALSETVGLAHEDRIHLVTGRAPRGAANGQWNDQGDVDAHLVFLPGENRWDTARPAPMARNSASGAVLDGALWVAGGRTVDGGGTGRLDRYDPVADRWDTLAPIPVSPDAGRQVGGGLAMVSAGGRLVAFGGEWFEGRGGGVFAETWLYDPAVDDWSAGPRMATPRHGLAAAVVDGVIYAIGGGETASGGMASDALEALTLSAS